MNVRATDIALARGVSPQDVRAYLSAYGWDRLGPLRGSKGDAWCLREDERESVLVPASTEFADYATRLLQLADSVGRVENRPSSTVLADLSLAGFDLVRVRLPSGGDENPMSLSTGVGLLEESRNLLLAAACSVSRPRSAFRADLDRKAVSFVDRVGWGRNGHDSFAVDLSVPVAPSSIESEPGGPSRPEPFERRVTRMLVSGLRGSREAAVRLDREGDVRHVEERIGEGVSANLCRAVANLIGAGNGLDVFVRWALCRQPPEEAAEGRSVVAFTRSDAPALREAARCLGERQ